MFAKCSTCGKVPWNVLIVAKGTFSDIKNIKKDPIASSPCYSSQTLRIIRITLLCIYTQFPINFPVCKQFPYILFLLHICLSVDL